MLGKLLKYDLKWAYKPLIVFYILSIFFAIITRIMTLFDNSLILIIIEKICSGITIAMFANVVINNFFRIWGRVTRNLYKDESYLTHTLPVDKETIFLSKILTAIITMLTSSIIIVSCIAIAYLTNDNWQALKTIMEQTAIYFNSSVSSVIITIIITLFFELLFMIMSGIIGITIGYKFNNLKTIKSILAGFLLYTIPSLLSVGIIYIMGLFNSDIMNLFISSEVINTEALKVTLYGAITAYIIYNIIYYFIGKKILNKGVNVE